MKRTFIVSALLLTFFTPNTVSALWDISNLEISPGPMYEAAMNVDWDGPGSVLLTVRIIDDREERTSWHLNLMTDQRVQVDGTSYTFCPSPKTCVPTSHTITYPLVLDGWVSSPIYRAREGAAFADYILTFRLKGAATKYYVAVLEDS